MDANQEKAGGRDAIARLANRLATEGMPPAKAKAKALAAALAFDRANPTRR